MDFEIPQLWSPGCLTLITGPSGAGKTTLMRLLCEQLADPIYPQIPESHGDLPLIETAAADPELAIRRLTPVGLGDPILWCKTIHELSDGQRERLKLAAVLSLQGTPVIDEWLAPLDRTTAQCVAYTTGKRLRQQGRGGIFVTSHSDLTSYLRPDWLIEVGWEPKPKVVGLGWDEETNPIVAGLEFHVGVKADWKMLAPLHYAAGDPATFAEVYQCAVPGESIPAGVVVLSYPDLHSSARTLAFNGEHKIGGSSEKAREINRRFRRLSRIVIAPQFRSCGVASALIEYACSRTPADYVECSTAMGRWSGFLDRAGFTQYPNEMSKIEAELAEFAETRSLPFAAMIDPGMVPMWEQTLSVRDSRTWRRLVYALYHQMVIHRRTRKPLPKRVPNLNPNQQREATALALKRLHERPTYWVRPARSEGVNSPSEWHNNGTVTAQAEA